SGPGVVGAGGVIGSPSPRLRRFGGILLGRQEDRAVRAGGLARTAATAVLGTDVAGHDREGRSGILRRGLGARPRLVGGSLVGRRRVALTTAPGLDEGPYRLAGHRRLGGLELHTGLGEGREEVPALHPQRLGGGVR